MNVSSDFGRFVIDALRPRAQWSVNMSHCHQAAVFVELKEFASFRAAEQRYIRRSLDVAFGHGEAIEHWARGVEEAAAIGRQARAYDIIDELRSLVSEPVQPNDATPPLPPLVRVSAFDLQQGKLNTFAAYRFLYERLLGASVRPWLVSAFAAAAALPCMSAVGWATREASFFPEWVEKVPLALV